MSKVFFVLMAFLIILGMCTTERSVDPLYVIGIYIGNGETVFYVTYRDSENNTARISECRTEMLLSKAMTGSSRTDSPDLVMTYLRAVYISPDASTEAIGSFLSYAHAVLPLNCKVAVCDYKTLSESDARETPAPLAVPELLRGENGVSIFAYMNGKRVPTVFLDSGVFIAEVRNG